MYANMVLKVNGENNEVAQHGVTIGYCPFKYIYRMLDGSCYPNISALGMWPASFS